MISGGGGGGPPPSGEGGAAAVSGGKPGAMRDPSKPPGPNPKWGYWEWDSESKMWELEDYRRKRRQAHRGVLAGKTKHTQCSATATATSSTPPPPTASLS